MKNNRIYDDILTKEFLTEEYVEKNRTSNSISKQLKITRATIHKYLKLYGIPENNKKVQLISGMKFNMLTTVEITGRAKYGCYIWKCVCDCGKYTNVRVDQLKAKNTENMIKSCGCSKKSGGENVNWTGFKTISGRYWSTLKYNANSRNIDFNISIEQAWEIFEKQNGKCYLSGIELSFNEDKKTRSITASLDRLDSSKAYSVDNVGWVHKNINKIKYIFSVKEFIYYCGLVSNFKGIFDVSNYNFVTHDTFISSAKLRYKKRNFIFDLTGEQIVQKFNDQGGVCAFTGLDLIFPDSNSNFKSYKHTASLDRIDNNLGYSFDNVQFVHKLINKSRSNLTIERYKELCNIVHSLPTS